MKRFFGFLKRSWAIYGTAIIVCSLGFLLASRFIKPAPPDVVKIAAGEQGGAYYEYAKKYAEYLKKEKITLEILETSGSVDNLELVARGVADIAIVQGGIRDGGEGSVEGVGSLFVEPLWLFHSQDLDIDRIPELSGLQVAIGPEGSGTQALVRKIFSENNVRSAGDVRPLSLSSSKAADALIAGDIDAAFFVASPDSHTVDRLLRTPGVVASSLDRDAAYARRYVFLEKFTLPEGSIDLEANVPRQDLNLVAATANLVANRDLHPAIASLMLQAATEIHGKGGLFADPGRFPTPDYLDFPVSDSAANFYEHGPPFLQRYLPFWAASLVDRLKIMLLPLLVLLFPMLKVMPSLYRWRMQSKVYRWYQELEAIDLRSEGGDLNKQLLEELNELERDVRKINVPLAYAGQVYILRQHIDLIRSKVAAESKK